MSSVLAHPPVPQFSPLGIQKDGGKCKEHVKIMKLPDGLGE